MLGARLVMFAIADNAWADGIAFPSQGDLTESTLLSERSVRSGLREAEELDELETRKARKGRSFFNVYRVTVGPIRQVEVDYGRLEKMGIRVTKPFSSVAELSVSTGKSCRVNHGTQPEENDHFNRQSTTVQPADFDRAYKEGNRKESEEEPSAAAAGDLQDLGDRLLAETIRGELDALVAGAKLRQLALAEPERALAWIQVAKTDAVRNPAGFVLAGLESGDWPSVRGRPPGPTEYDRCRHWIEHGSATRLDPDHAHSLVDEYDLGEVERQELHELLDQAIDVKQTTAAEAAA